MKRLALLLLATPALADAQDDAAIAYFKAGYKDACYVAFDEAGLFTAQPERWDLQVPTSYGEKEPVTLWHFPCGQGAYNSQELYVLNSDLDGMRVATFAAPDLNIVTTDPNDPDSKVVSVAIAGWTADVTLVNPTFDPKTLTMKSHASWRGLDDAFDEATYQLIDGHFRLVHYEADPDYDGTQKPQVLYDAGGN